MKYENLAKAIELDKEIKSIQEDVDNCKKATEIEFASSFTDGLYCLAIDHNDKTNPLTIAANEYHEKVIDILETKKAKFIVELEKL